MNAADERPLATEPSVKKLLSRGKFVQSHGIGALFGQKMIIGDDLEW